MSYYRRSGQKYKRKATVRYLVHDGVKGKILTVDPRRKKNFIISEIELIQPVGIYLLFKRKNIDYVVRVKAHG